MPSKALLRAGHALLAAQRVPGVIVKDQLDVAAVLKRRNKIVTDWDDASQVQWAQGADISVIRGHAMLSAERTVRVGDQTLTANKAVVICTGSTPRLPKLAGLAEVPYWTSRDATSAQTAPESLIVLGGGVVGVEMAQAWAQLGTSVTLVITGPRPLPQFEPFAGDLVADGLRASGVTILANTAATGVSASPEAISLQLADGSTISGERFLVATGRKPATDNLGVDKFGLTPGQALPVDDNGRVQGMDWLYAAGDVTGRAPLTHQGKYAARAVGTAIATGATSVTPWSAAAASADHVAVPQVVFTDPEVAAVGRTESQARQAGMDVRVVDHDIAVAGSTIHADGYRGKARIVIDESNRTLVGATFVGQDVAEMLHAATIAIVGEVPIDRLWHAVPAYPTISEVWLRLLESYGL